MTNKVTNLTTVSFLRLITGDDIVAVIEDEDDFQITIKDPYIMVTEMDVEELKQTVYMYPWIPQGIVKDTSVTLESELIIFRTSLEDDVRDHYLGIVFENSTVKVNIKDSNAKKLSEMDSEDKKNVVSFKSKKDTLN